MKAVEVLLYLQRNGITVFTTGDLAKIINKPVGYAMAAVRKIPGVKMAEKGVYYTEQANIYEIASNITPFSYVSMLAALKFHELTTQRPIAIEVVSQKRHRPLEVEGYKIIFIKLKRELMFGHVRRRNAFIAEPEKAILDSLYRNEYAYLDEALGRGIEDGTINSDKLVSYAYRFGRRSLLNKLGFFLEHYAGISKPELLDNAADKPISLVPGATLYDKKWRLYYG